MSETPDPGASPAAPKSTLALDLVQAGKELIPPLALAVTLIIMTQWAIPTANHDPVTIIISGFLGFLTGRGSKPATAPPAA